MNTGTVAGIFICADAGLPMQNVACIQALKGVGLKGDRYARRKGSFQAEKVSRMRDVTIIEAEAIEGSGFTPAQTRRNIVVKNFPLESLICQEGEPGVEFYIGQVRFRSSWAADPCERPSKLSGIPGFKETFKGKGGMRAQVLTDGFFCEGDIVRLA